MTGAACLCYALVLFFYSSVYKSAIKRLKLSIAIIISGEAAS